jgi:hypothetical protein
VLVSGAAFAQQPAQAPAQDSALAPETVYSDAQRGEDESLSRRTVQSVLAPVDTFENQYSRWKMPVCFNVYGLAAAAKYVVERRMKDVAQQVGAPLDRNEACVPSVTIVFTVDPQATLQSIAKVRPWLVPGLDMIRSRARQSQPIQAWYATAARGKSGRLQLLYDGYDDEPVRIAPSELSRLSTGIETEMAGVTVIVDTKSIMGMQLGTLADHFALVSLAEAQYSTGCKPVRTVANLMHRNCDPALVADALTPGDIALLTGLYKTDDQRLQAIQGQRITGNMRKTLEDAYKAGERK